MKSDECVAPSSIKGPKTLSAPIDEEWTAVISPDSSWFPLDLREIWHYRHLILLFVRRDFVAQYKQTILGPLWFFLQPLFTTIVFTIVFGKIAKIPTGGVPTFLFYLSGIVCWGYFSACLLQNSDTFNINAQLFGKAYFPRLVVPISVAISNIIRFLMQFFLFVLFFLYYAMQGAEIGISLLALLLPLLIIQMAFLGMGVGILISSLTTKYRDLTLLVGLVVQLWMYATPIVYPLSLVPQPYRIFFFFNPMTFVVETFRRGFLGGEGVFYFGYLVISWTITLALLLIGLLLFSRIEKTFLDSI